MENDHIFWQALKPWIIFSVNDCSLTAFRVLPSAKIPKLRPPAIFWDLWHGKRLWVFLNSIFKFKTVQTLEEII